MKEIKDFIEVIQDDYEEVQGDLLICKQGHCTEECRTQNEIEVAVYKKIIGSPEYKALKAKEEDKPYMLKTSTCPDCNYKVIECICNVEEPNNEGWIKHDGGSTPVDKCGSMVVAANKNIEIKRRDGILEKVGLAGKVKWNWCKHYDELDIIEFRIIEGPKKPEKQTLLEFMDEKNSYKGEPLLKPASGSHSWYFVNGVSLSGYMRHGKKCFHCSKYIGLKEGK